MGLLRVLFSMGCPLRRGPRGRPTRRTGIRRSGAGVEDEAAAVAAGGTAAGAGTSAAQDHARGSADASVHAPAALVVVGAIPLHLLPHPCIAAGAEAGTDAGGAPCHREGGARMT